MIKKDFDAWGYSLVRPRRPGLLPLSHSVILTAEDVKFAYNAWCLLRLAMFLGTGRPKVLSGLTRTTPSMAIQHGGNRLFYMHAEIDARLARGAHRIALCPSHPAARPVHDFPWRHLMHGSRGDGKSGVELVVGMENGMSPRVADQCEHRVYIPQYGSIGSLSMLSALAIAAHYAAQAHYDSCMQPITSCIPHRVGEASLGHMPRSNSPLPLQPRRPASPPAAARPLPHEANLLHHSNDEIRALLAHRRSAYALQLAVAMYNELGDRNIGAVMRNANAFNCASMHVLHRRRFNRRGSLGTHTVLDVRYHDSTTDRSFAAAVDGYELWLLYPYYPYLHIHGIQETRQSELTFLRYSDPLLQSWLAAQRSPSQLLSRSIFSDSGLCSLAGAAHAAVFLDDDFSTHDAVTQAAARGMAGIMLVVPEEGCTVHPSLASLCHRVAYVCHPSRTAHAVQRGLTPALATAIALQRLRHAIDQLRAA